ncbi:unnamed protein product [Orchesella dallaii]|uniref:Alpha-carbonic anhydrase domain-containing protein n=1 Tax=Orchesella dallaii TaxID=48710 RepID=A0ABP1QMC4_9HEXA
MIYCRKVPRKLLLTKLFVLILQLSFIFGIEETPTDQQLEQNNLEQTNQQSQEQQNLEETEPNLGQNEQENQDRKEPQSHEQTEPNQGQNEQDNQDQKDQNLEQNEQNKEQLNSEHQKPENPAHQNLEEKESSPSPPLEEKEQQTPKENEHENVVQSAFESQTPIWCYQDPSCGEATWGNLCSSGTAQSPIDLPEMEDPTCLIKNFPLSSYQSQLYTLETDGRTLGIKLLDTLPSFHWDDQEASYSLHSMHMHWSSNDSSGGSEHTINSTQFAAELHMIQTILTQLKRLSRQEKRMRWPF